jgi:glycosyltransferase involved in cell wall biosynthesis
MATGQSGLIVLRAQPRPVFSRYLEAADLALAPYHLGVFPGGRFYYSSLKVREYLAFDLAVAATSGTAADLIEDGMNGFLLEQNQGWGELFDRLPDREQLHRMGEGGRERVSSYTYDHVADRYLVLSTGRRAPRGQPADVATLQES